MLDFSKTVLAACQAVFGDPVTYHPVASAPGMAPFAARGIFEADHELIEDMTGSHAMGGRNLDVPLSTTAPILGIRQSEFPVQPKQDDEVTIRGVVYVVFDVKPDAEGETILVLRTD